MMEGGHGCEGYIHNRPIDFESVPLALISPIFGRLLDDLITNHENLLSQDFTPAKNLANMFSELEENVVSRKKSFSAWLLDMLPDIERKESSHGEARERPMTTIIKGERRDKEYWHRVRFQIQVAPDTRCPYILS
jgi:hypothetical protein